MSRRRPMLWMFGLAVPILLAGTGAVWAATGAAPPQPTAQSGTQPAADAAAADDGPAPAAKAAAVNPNCTLIVPPNPLSAAGLATPYRLTATDPKQGTCHESNTDQAAFVQATMVDPATGKLGVYNPLVIDDGAKAAATPVTPKLPAGAVVGIWFGYNGDTLTLKSNRGSVAAGKCVNGDKTSMFGQFAYCNAPAFFTAANAAVKAGKLAVPALGTARDGKVCPTTRDFSVVDMDQSDNVTAAYLVLKNGTLAQNTAANRAKFNGGRSHVLVNGSDNLLLDGFVDAALGCTPFTAPDLADPNATSTSLALNELQAAKQAAPVAVVPPTDPMAMDGTKASLGKTNLYRDGVNQPSLAAIGSSGKDYCRNLVDVAPQRIQLDRNLTTKTTSPDKAAANNLFTFLAQRLRQSFITLNCRKLLGTRNPVRLVLDKNGVAVDATFTKPVAALPANTAPMDNPLSAQIAADPAAAQPIEF